VRGPGLTEPPDRQPIVGYGPGLQQAHKNRGDDSMLAELAETAELLYGTALLAEGGELEDPAKFAGLLADRIARTM